MRTSLLLRGGKVSKLQLPSITESYSLSTSSTRVVVIATADVTSLLCRERSMSPADVSIATASVSAECSVVAQSLLCDACIVTHVSDRPVSLRLSALVT